MLDAGALLRLWKADEEECADLLRCITELDEQVFVPCQVLSEVTRLAPVIRHDTARDLDRVRAALLRDLARVEFEARRNRDHFGLEPVVFRHFVREVGEAKSTLCHLFDKRKGEFGESAVAAEEFLDRMGASGLRVGNPADPVETRRRERIARRMVKDKAPPGGAVKGRSTPEPRRLGDCLIWLELLEYVPRRGRDIVFVTTDFQSNGWVQRRRGDSWMTNAELVTRMKALGVEFTVVGVRQLIGACTAEPTGPDLRVAAGAQVDLPAALRPFSLFTEWADDVR